MAAEDAPRLRITVLSVASSVIFQDDVQRGSPVGGLREELCGKLGYPLGAIKLLRGHEELQDDYIFDWDVEEHELLLHAVFTLGEALLEVALLDAARYGHHGLASALLRTQSAEACRDLFRMKDQKGHGALQLAGQRGHASVVQALAEAAERHLLLPCLLLEPSTFSRFTTLHWASLHGHLAVVEALLAAAACQDGVTGLQRGILLVRCKKGNTALHIAAQEGYTGIVQALLNAAAAVGARHELLLACSSSDGMTPLHLACRYGRDTVQEFLLAAAKVEGVEEEFRAVRSLHGATAAELARRAASARRQREIKAQQCEALRF